MVFQIKEHHVKHDARGRPLNMLNVMDATLFAFHFVVLL